jgi:hypothetical protein
MFPVRYELSFHIPEDGILPSHRRENLKSYELNHIWAEWIHLAQEDGPVAGSYEHCNELAEFKILRRDISYWWSSAESQFDVSLTCFSLPLTRQYALPEKDCDRVKICMDLHVFISYD